ncbi:MAG TPA: hypothetical protein VGR73_06955 [Bryobacteraceae bacterium]|nr:hypothetical protein [Bryobacteraceae bacterium]
MCRIGISAIDLKTHETAREIAGRYHNHIYDALVLAAAGAAWCRILYSEDLQPGQAIGGVTVRNPFLPE